jgi:hypothetical protein
MGDKPPVMPLPKMMLGFVVRRCAVALGHAPTPKEFAAWANAQHNGNSAYALFGRAITEREAALILRHPERPVSARSAAPHEQVTDGEAAGNVIPISAAVRHRARAKALRRR